MCLVLRVLCCCQILVLHMDHEQNASTSTVRTAGVLEFCCSILGTSSCLLVDSLSAAAGSSHANPFACIASGIAALWGPAHGGANGARRGRCASCITRLQMRSLAQTCGIRCTWQADNGKNISGRSPCVYGMRWSPLFPFLLTFAGRVFSYDYLAP